MLIFPYFDRIVSTTSKIKILAKEIGKEVVHRHTATRTVVHSLQIDTSSHAAWESLKFNT